VCRRDLPSNTFTIHSRCNSVVVSQSDHRCKCVDDDLLQLGHDGNDASPLVRRCVLVRRRHCSYGPMRVPFLGINSYTLAYCAAWTHTYIFRIAFGHSHTLEHFPQIHHLHNTSVPCRSLYPVTLESFRCSCASMHDRIKAFSFEADLPTLLRRIRSIMFH